jgi:4-hydroxy-2-oxoheptanedioate aldolase
MSTGSLRARWLADECVLACWLTLPEPLGAEILARQGWPALVLDLQHGALDDPSALRVLQALHGLGTVPLLRVPWLDPGAVMKALDRGAQGVICPMIDSAEQAERFVQACLYPPMGIRSWGPVRAGIDGASAYAREANELVAPIVQIETLGALEQLDAILAVPGLAAIFVGPNDLAWALGHGPGSDREEPELLELLLELPQRAREHGVQAGIHCAAPAYARRMTEAGYRLITIGSDASFLARSGRVMLSSLGAAEPRRA